MINPLIYSLLIRTFVPLLILRWPFYGFVMSMLADSLGDLILLDIMGYYLNDNYHYFDKFLDLYMISIAVLVSLRFEKLEKWTSVVLYSIRATGTLLFGLTGLRIFLIVFPNVFEYFFLFIAAAKKFWPKFRLTGKNLPMIIAILTMPKLICEFLMHYFGFDMAIWNFWLRIKSMF